MTTSNDTMPATHTATSGVIRNLQIGGKLTIGFGLLVVCTLLIAIVGWYASEDAIEQIERTNTFRMPAALASSQAQADLLRMFGDIRGYLALGDRQFIQSYNVMQQQFEHDLQTLQALAPYFDEVNQQRLQELQTVYEEWTAYPGKLFDLRDDQMEREPAYNWLNTDGAEHGILVLINIHDMIQQQSTEEPSLQNNELIKDMAEFQSSFAAMFSGLRGYVTTRNPNFRFYEYQANATINQGVWQKLQRSKHMLSVEQQQRFDTIEENLTTFITIVPQKLFVVLQASDYSWRKDLYLFTTEVESRTTRMQTLLNEITQSQQQLLRQELAQGSNSLVQSRWQTGFWSVVALLLGTAMAIFFRGIIAGPVRRLTAVAKQIREGDLDVTAKVESTDEIGTFADMFNHMTRQLRDNLVHIRREKRRADDLLTVVIPIGVQLSSERDFNRLLENMVMEAMAFCKADGGTLFLHKDNILSTEMVHITSLHVMLGGTSNQPVPPTHAIELFDAQGNPISTHIAAATIHEGKTINVADAYNDDVPFDFTRLFQYDRELNYHTTSVLSIPLKNNDEHVLGVLQLINAEDDNGAIIPFDVNLQQMMESFSSLAAAALESYVREQSLRQEIQQLRIEIDETKRQQQVSEIVDTDFFQDLQNKARNLRQRGSRKRRDDSQDDANS